MSWSSPLGAQRLVRIPLDYAKRSPHIHLSFTSIFIWTVLFYFMSSVFVEREEGFRDLIMVVWRCSILFQGSELVLA
jgi:hypothetical protein